jgi:shikimate dehydrogenase
VSRGLRALQPYVVNPLPPEPSPRTWLCGLIGDHPSRYSRSPAIWNAAFRRLDLDAYYVPLDVAPTDLGGLVAACRLEPRFLGANVTVPHKQAIVPLLDELEPSAERAGAVNTVARTAEGWLVGANTDGRGALDSLTRPWPGREAPFIASLERKSALLIGAGGSGRAVAFALAEALGPAGRLFIANRTAETALELGRAVEALFGNAGGLDEADAELLGPGLDLIVNASTRGQAGLCAAGSGRVTYLEPYSALAPADPPPVPDRPGESEADRLRAWLPAAIPDIRANHAASLRFVTRTAPHTAFFDLVYAPPETTTLRHARWSGHPTLNGRGMILFQAVAAFCDHIVRPKLEARGRGEEETRRIVLEAMAAAWGSG